MGVLVKDVQFVKATPRKLLFMWSTIERWLKEGEPRLKQLGKKGPPESLITI